ncbi:MAG: caspase family protein [Planctomycetaceae bacterium]
MKTLALVVASLPFVFVSFLAQAAAQETLNEASEVRSGTKVVRTEYRLLVTGVFQPNLGLRISNVDPSGPGAWMSSPNGRTRGILERGDVVIAINGRPVASNHAYFEAINATNGDARITVRDVNTGRHFDWFVQPAPVRVVGPPSAPTEGRATALKVLLIGDTDDDSIGKMIEVSIGELNTTLHLFEDRNSIIVTGRDVTAESILAAIDRIDVLSTDAFLCYFISHGAYDPSRATNDVSGGHFFSLRGGDLMRKKLMDRLKSKGARLTVLISDTCNMRSSATPVFSRHVPYSFTIGENPVLANLFLDHIGIVDLSGSSRDQYGWFSTQHGGWFTSSLVALCEPGVYAGNEFVTWDRFAQDLSIGTSRLYQMNKQNVLDEPGSTRPDVLDQLRSQGDQRPQVFQNQTRRTN